LPRTEQSVPAINIPPRGRLQIDGIAALALASAKNSEISSITIPAEEELESIVFLHDKSAWSRALPIYVRVDTIGGGVMGVADPRTLDAAQWTIDWARIIHFGHRLGGEWTVLAFVSGLLPILFAVTGTYIWYVKRIRRRGMIPAAAEADT
jgi:uncharacterized iron-regulated membrane protein